MWPDLRELGSLVRTMTRALEAPMKLVAAACCIAMIAAPSFAQFKNREPAFYVVRDTVTGRCSVVDKLPTSDLPNVTIASDAIYDTRAEAEVAIRTLKPCTS
jgi:hypothetical protein